MILRPPLARRLPGRFLLCFLAAVPVMAAPVAASEPIASMCRMSRPVDVITEWAEVPEVRRGRILADLGATITDDERAIDPGFDGFRIAAIDHIWSYASPDDEVSLHGPLDLRIDPVEGGFTVRFQRGRRGEPTALDGCEDCFEFIPVSGWWQYRFERRDGCWALTDFSALPGEAD